MTGILEHCTGFDWDEGNSEKNQLSHQVSRIECEEVFFNEPLVIFSDDKHSMFEKRWYLLGKTDNERKLFIVFTVRKEMVRVISARDMSKKEREYYAKI